MVYLIISNGTQISCHVCLGLSAFYRFQDIFALSLETRVIKPENMLSFLRDYDTCGLGHDIYFGKLSFYFHGIAKNTFHEHFTIMGNKPDNPFHRLIAGVAFQGIDCKFAHSSSRIIKADPAGFEPATPGLEARCYILAKPRVR
jgi:hypothetical protein